MRGTAFFIVSFAAIAGLLAVRIADPVALKTIRGLTFDFYQELKPRPYRSEGVRVVDIDDESLRRIGQWPWPRTVIARLIETLRVSGATAIALDIVFAEPDRTSPKHVLSLWPNSDDTARLRAAVADGRLADHDDILAKSIAQGKVITGFALKRGRGGTVHSKAGIATNGPDPLGRIPAFGGALGSLEVIQRAAAGNGALTMVPDADGVLRRLPLLLRKADKVYPSLAVETLRVAQASKTYVARAASPGNLGSLMIGRHHVPTDGAGQIYLYDTGPVAQRIVPAWRVLDGGLDFSRTIVFVGSSALGIEDVQHSPLSTVTLGVAIHAQAVEQILSGDFLLRPDWAGGLEIMSAVLLGVLLILVLRRVSPWGAVSLTTLSVVTVIAVSWYAFSILGILLDPGFIVAVVCSVYLVCAANSYLSSERQRRQVRAAFGQYLSPAMVDQLAARPELLSLGGEMKEVTILFCDIRGFTSLSENLEAEALSHLVNRFLTAMTEAILENGGTIDKYIGDCVMAFWNAPVDDSAHARKACEAALAMRRALHRLNEELRADTPEDAASLGTIAMGVGINTGQCCVGNMGSEQRFNYSVLGDTVNLAARLEEETKAFGVDVVIGESTRHQVDGLGFRELGEVTVRGRSQPVHVFTLAEAAQN